MEGYWDKIRQKVAEFSVLNDRLVCIDVRKSLVDQTCELCGYSPIRWVHSLRNERTGNVLHIGSNCIHNYKDVSASANSGVSILYPRKYQKVADRLNINHPNTVDIDVKLDEDFKDYDGYSDREAADEAYSPDRPENVIDIAPEGLGPDEVDWDSFDNTP